MFNKLLIPLDGSPLAEQALGQAAAIVRACGASVDLVLAHAPVAFGAVRGVQWGDTEWVAAERYLEALGKDLATRAGGTVTHSLLRGEPVQLISDRATEIGADLIVMTSHGRTGFRRALLGSVADGVMRNAKTPVLILRPLEGPTAFRGEAHQVFKHVLIPLDGSSTEIVSSAIALAKCGNARVTLLRVVQPVPQVRIDAGFPSAAIGAALEAPAMTEIADAASEQLADVARRLHADTGLEAASQVILESPVATSILEFALANGIDVIAMASYSGALSRIFLGSVANEVARGADVPVLLYKPT
jgi:nucleotide-binding universal stress UspA family protein